MLLIRALVLVGLLAGAAQAFSPESLPDAAVETHDHSEDPGSVSFPTGVYEGETPRIALEGRLRWRAWEIPSANLSTLRIIRGLRADLAARGYEVMLDCATEDCGGFDFRYGLPVLPAPEMNVDLFDFRVITAKSETSGGTEHVFILVSRGRVNRFVQIVEVSRKGASSAAPAAPVAAVQPDATAPTASGLVAALVRDGHVVLPDLDFASGARALSDREYGSLADLTGYLAGNSARVIALVGHTDAVGSLEANIALSRQRAESVRRLLIDRYGVAPGQVVAQGAGYLAPVASHLTQAGREANRRVEAVLLSGE